LTSRVVNSLSVTFLVLYTTSFTEIVRGLKLFRVPDAMVMVILLTYKYLFVLVRLVEEMHLARKARLAGEESRSDTTRWAAGRMGMLFLRTQMRCEDINKGMLARGFSGDHRGERFAQVEPSGPAGGRRSGPGRRVPVAGVRGVGMEGIIALRGVHYSYHGRIPALAGVDLTVQEGKKLAVIGANGSGKSTLLQVMAALIHPHKGEVRFRGRVVSREALENKGFLRYFRERVGYVFQDPEVQLFCPTVLEELMFGPLQLGLGREGGAGAKPGGPGDALHRGAQGPALVHALRGREKSVWP
jgi:ABC-type multidrug transport system fused ATPase/permease subunit